MIAFLYGHIIDRNDGHVVLITSGGVGYDVCVGKRTLAQWDGTSENINVWVHTAVSADAIKLFGFGDKESLGIFQQLIGVTGVGPKGALGLLDTLTIEQIGTAIVTGDTRTLSSAPGIGPRTAAKVIFELKGKLTAGTTIDPKLGAVRSALEELGYRLEGEIAPILEELPDDEDDIGELVRIALQRLGSRT